MARSFERAALTARGIDRPVEHEQVAGHDLRGAAAAAARGARVLLVVDDDRGGSNHDACTNSSV